MFSDDVKIWKLDLKGNYEKVPNLTNSNAQEILIENAIQRARLVLKENKTHVLASENQKEELNKSLEDTSFKNTKDEKKSFFERIKNLFIKK